MPRLLLADDDEGITVPLSAFLERSGFDVEVAHDGIEALRFVCEHQPDVAILDVRMPVSMDEKCAGVCGGSRIGRQSSC